MNLGFILAATLCAWVFLLLLSGERQKRIQVMESRIAAEQAAAAALAQVQAENAARLAEEAAKHQPKFGR